MFSHFVLVFAKWRKLPRSHSSMFLGHPLNMKHCPTEKLYHVYYSFSVSIFFFPFWYSFYSVTWTGTFFSKSVFIFKYLLLLKMCISLISYLARTWGNCWTPLQSFSFFGWLFSSLKSYQNRQYTEFSRYNKVMRIWWFLFCTGEEFVCNKFLIFWFTNIRRVKSLHVYNFQQESSTRRPGV